MSRTDGVHDEWDRTTRSLSGGVMRQVVMLKEDDPSSLFQHNIEIVSKSQPYEKNTSGVLGTEHGTYVDYRVRVTMAFRDDLPFSISSNCDYKVLFSPTPHNYKTFQIALIGGRPATEEFTFRMPIVEKGQFIGVFKSTSGVEENKNVSINIRATEVDIYDRS